MSGRTRRLAQPNRWFAPDDPESRYVLPGGDSTPVTIRRRLRYRFTDLGSLEPAEFDRLYLEMADVVVDAAEVAGEDSWAGRYWNTRKEKARSQSAAYTARDGDRLVGFMFFTISDLGRWTGLLIESGFVRPEYQRRGVGFALCARIAHRAFWRHPWKEFLWVSELINPVILNGWLSRFPATTEMVPGVFGKRSAELDVLAPRLARMLFPDNDYDADSSVLTHRTTPRPSLTSWSGVPRIDNYFDRHMNPRTGDSLFYLAAFDHITLIKSLGLLARSALRMMDRRVRRRPG